MPIDPKKIAEWRALADAATHGTPAWDDLAPVDADFLRTARVAVPALLAEREEMLALLRAMQWAVPQGMARVCPSCRGVFGEGGHTPDCRLAAFLR